LLLLLRHKLFFVWLFCGQLSRFWTLAFKFKTLQSHSCSAKIAPNIACSGRVDTFRLRAFFRSKIWFRFVGRFSCQLATNANR
jgi:hypothetical protein